MTVREALEAHHLPGAVAVVAQGDEAVTVVGEAARNSLFRIASIGKPITAAAVMMLVEAGTAGLDDPIARWFPELASPVVVRTPDAPADDVVPVSREVTVRDVLEFRAGWGFPADFSLPAVQVLFQEAFPFGRAFSSSDEWVAGLARVPLLHQPGEGWLYNACSDLKGVLVERVSGMPFPAFLAERVFEPLGMVDTAFFAPAEKRDRLLPYFAPDLSPADPSLDRYTEPPGFASGAGGLVSTVDDMLAFARLLLARGGDLLGESSFELMTTDHLPEKQREEASLFLEGQGWGYGGAVDRDTGRYGWVGGSGTTFHVVPATGTAAILLTQVQMAGPTPPPVMRDFWSAAGIG